MDYSGIYLESIRMKNFQSWKDLEIKLCHGLNVIVAPNGVGKSVIFKALRVVVNPEVITSDDRSDFLRYNSSCAEVYYTFNDNCGYAILINGRENIYYFIKDLSSPNLEVLGSTPPQDLLDRLAIVKRGNLIGNMIDFSKDMFLVNSDQESNSSMLDLLSSSERMDKLIEVIENTKLPIAKEAYKNITYKKKTIDNLLNFCNYQNIDAKEQNIQLAEDLLNGSKILVLIEKYLLSMQSAPVVDLNIKLISDDLYEFNSLNDGLLFIQNYGDDLSIYKNLTDSVAVLDGIVDSGKKVITSKFCNLLSFVDSTNSLSLYLSKSEKEVKVDAGLLTFLSLSDKLVSTLQTALSVKDLEDEIDCMKAEVQHEGGEIYECPIYGTIRFVNEECIPNY